MDGENGIRAAPASLASRVTLRSTAFAVLAVLGLVLVWTRLRHIDQSFWHDEAFTVLNYSGQGPEAILFGDTSFGPNNHVLYNLLSWATVAAIAPTEAVYHAWSVIPGILAVGLATWWAWRRLGIATAVTFATLATGSQLHADQVPYARGYGLAVLAAVAILICADRLTQGTSVKRVVAFAAIGLIGTATLYSFALVFAGQALALLSQPRLRRPVLAAVAVAGCASVIFYGPVLSDVIDTRPLSDDAISLSDALTLNSALSALSFIGAPTWVAPVGLAVLVYAVVVLVRRGERDLALNLAVPPLVMNVVLSIAGAPPEPRYQLLLLPHILILVSLGLANMAIALGRARLLRPVLIGGALILAALLAFRTVEREEVGKALPPEDFKQAASVVEGTGIDRVVTDSVRPEGLQYYVGDDLAVRVPGNAYRVTCDSDRPLVYVRHAPIERDLLPRYARPAPLSCLKQRGALRIRLPQRQRGEAIDVWVLQPGGRS